MMTGREFRASWPYVGEMIRSLLGVLVVVAAALQWISAPAAIAAGISAAIAGSVALQDNPHGRARLTLAVSLATGPAVLAGWLTSPHTGWFVATVTLWCAAAGLGWAISANVGLVAASVSILVLVAPRVPDVRPGAPAVALLAVGAALLQVVLVAMWPGHRWQTQRDALAGAYRSIAENARDLAADPRVALDIDPLIALRESFVLTERQARRRPPVHRGLGALPERIALTLDTLRGAATAADAGATLLSAADVLTALADHGRGGSNAVRGALERLDEAVAVVPASISEAAVRLQAQLHEAADLQLVTMPPPVEVLRRAGNSIVEQMNWNSSVFRHTVRLAVAAGAGTALARIAEMGQGSWIALTILMVLRPETAHTYTRCVSRVIAIAFGAGLATTLTVFWHPGGAVAVVLTVLALAVVHAVSGIGYVALSAALAAAIVFLLDIGGSPGEAALGERLLATMVGGVLAVATHVVLPDRSLIRLRQRAGELLKAEIDYAAVIISAFVHHLADPGAAVSATWQRTVRARSAFEATSGSARTYRATLNAVTSACATLESQIPGTPPPNLDRRFVVAVDDYVDALRGDVPSPGHAWAVDAVHLTEADQQLRESASLLGREHSAQRLLVTEVETITRQLVSTVTRRSRR
jgi:uncharacterized membrane protein YccC